MSYLFSVWHDELPMWSKQLHSHSLLGTLVPTKHILPSLNVTGWNLAMVVSNSPIWVEWDSSRCGGMECNYVHAFRSTPSPIVHQVSCAARAMYFVRCFCQPLTIFNRHNNLLKWTAGPVRSEHHPDNITLHPIILGSALPRWRVLSIQVRLLELGYA